MSRTKNAFDILKKAARKFGAENGAMMAAAVSFYTLLSMLPLLLLGVAVLGYVVGSSERAFSSVVSFFNSFMPTSTFITGTLRGLVSLRGVISWIGIVVLLWTGSQLFVTLETALNSIWQVSRRPGFIQMRAKAVLLVLIFGAFLLLSIVSSSVVGFLSGASAELVRILAVVIGLISAIAMFLVVYKFTPDAEVTWRAAIISALFSGIVWTIAKELYRLYLTHLANFNNAYGSLGGVVILVMWIYYSSMILILGAELGYVQEHGAD